MCDILQKIVESDLHGPKVSASEEK